MGASWRMVRLRSGKTHTIEGCLTPVQVKALASGALPDPFVSVQHGSDEPSISADAGVTAELASKAGMIHRLVHGLFVAIGAAGADSSFKLSAQFIEIYNEGLRDLLQKGIVAETRRVARMGSRANTFCSRVC